MRKPQLLLIPWGRGHPAHGAAAARRVPIGAERGHGRVFVFYGWDVGSQAALGAPSRASVSLYLLGWAVLGHACAAQGPYSQRRAAWAACPARGGRTQVGRILCSSPLSLAWPPGGCLGAAGELYLSFTCSFRRPLWVLRRHERQRSSARRPGARRERQGWMEPVSGQQLLIVPYLGI